MKWVINLICFYRGQCTHLGISFFFFHRNLKRVMVWWYSMRFWCHKVPSSKMLVNLVKDWGVFFVKICFASHLTNTKRLNACKITPRMRRVFHKVCCLMPFLWYTKPLWTLVMWEVSTSPPPPSLLPFLLLYCLVDRVNQIDLMLIGKSLYWLGVCLFI